MEKVKIELQDISKSYYSETTVTQALRKISLSFAEHEFVAITGESGSGKSTLLNIIGGMDNFDDGEMFVDGQPTFQYDEQEWEEYRRNKIGYVFQDYSLVGHYTALANVMSALLVMGYEQERAEETAMKYLEQVGLKGFETHKASELSSGQKQRLSIARALAKNTGIIVADEPTGNLDSETGEQIVSLLGELSKERLVIMVTHNYDQAETYVTRKIRLHDGRIVSDVSVNQGTSNQNTLKAGDETEKTREKLPEELQKADSSVQMRSEKEEKKRQNKVAAYFAGMNRRTQRGRAFLFTFFLFVVSTVSFLFIGELYQHADDTLTKEYSTAVFRKEDSKRLVVKREDGKEITQEDIKKFNSLSNVVMADSCDYANDINYYMEEGEDYKYIYGIQRGKSADEIKTVSFLNEDRFMLSTDCIAKEDLAEGRLPESRNEVVLYSDDKKDLEKEILFYFQPCNSWGPNEYYCKTMTVVGLLKEETEQVYFSTELCNMLSLSMDYGEYRLYTQYDKWYGDYKLKREYIPVIGDNLEKDEVRNSYKNKDTGPFGEVLFHFDECDRNKVRTGETREQNVVFASDYHDGTGNILEFSEEFFYEYCPKDRGSIQASVYLTSYAKVDSVIRRLGRMGYEAQSTYRVGVTEYVEELVNERMTIIGISIFGLVAILLAEVLILRSLMKIRVKDYFVLKFIGMKMRLIRKISYYEILAYCLTAMVATVIIMWILRIAGVSIIREMMWYYNLGAYLVFVVYNLIVSVLTVASFNHLLKGRLNA